MNRRFYWRCAASILFLYIILKNPILLKNPVLFLALALLFFACNKERNELAENTGTKSETAMTAGAEVPFLIRKGSHNCTANGFVPVSLLEQKFTVRFDSSAIYKSTIPLNQLDINKLYGFSDNGALHHDFSARFGWRWSDGALRLFAYVYNEGIVTSAEISTIDIGENIACALRVKMGQYEFQVADKIKTMPRSSTTATAAGYLLYPYFGGDEAAPHDVRIWIKNL
jgi:hypothetical protein